MEPTLRQAVEDFLRTSELMPIADDFEKLPEDQRKDFKRAVQMLEAVAYWYDLQDED